MVIYPQGNKPQLTILAETIAPVLGDPGSSIVMERVFQSYDSFPIRDIVVPLKATFTPNPRLSYIYQARLIAPVAQVWNNVLTSPYFSQFQMVFLPPPQNIVYYFNLMTPDGFCKSWQGGVFPLIISQTWDNDQLFEQTTTSQTATIYAVLPFAALKTLPSSVYWVQFQWNMEPIGAVTMPLLNFQALQLGIYEGYQQQLQSLLTVSNTPVFNATLNRNLLIVNREIKELSDIIFGTGSSG